MTQQNSPIKFAVLFISLFLLFYYFNILFFGITSPGNHYIHFLADHLNYIAGLRGLLLECSAGVLRLFGFSALTNNYELLVVGRGVIKLIYTCLGLGVMSFFAAFVLAYPKPIKNKIIFLISGLLIIQLLNIIRFVLLVLFWHRPYSTIVDHHTLFNAIIYIVISISLYFWVTTDTTNSKQHVKNQPVNL